MPYAGIKLSQGLKQAELMLDRDREQKESKGEGKGRERKEKKDWHQDQ